MQRVRQLGNSGSTKRGCALWLRGSRAGYQREHSRRTARHAPAAGDQPARSARREDDPVRIPDIRRVRRCLQCLEPGRAKLRMARSSEYELRTESRRADPVAIAAASQNRDAVCVLNHSSRCLRAGCRPSGALQTGSPGPSPVEGRGVFLRDRRGYVGVGLSCARA